MNNTTSTLVYTATEDCWVQIINSAVPNLFSIGTSITSVTESNWVFKLIDYSILINSNFNLNRIIYDSDIYTSSSSASTVSRQYKSCIVQVFKNEKIYGICTQANIPPVLITAFK